MRSRPLTMAVLICVIGMASDSLAATVTVPGTATIFLAGQPNGTVVPFPVPELQLPDVAPTNSPIAVDLSQFSPNSVLKFSVSGTSGRDADVPSAFVDADGEDPSVYPGGNPSYIATVPSMFNLSGIVGPFSSLLGVFLDSDQVYSTPTTLDFSANSQRSFVELSPELQQIFFIGDGLTGRGTGHSQLFQIPSNADYLYLAAFDSPNSNNGGELVVSIAQVPEPSTLTIMIAGAVILIGHLCRRQWQSVAR